MEGERGGGEKGGGKGKRIRRGGKAAAQSVGLWPPRICHSNELGQIGCKSAKEGEKKKKRKKREKGGKKENTA